MPVYLFTYHAYRSWMPDREQGFVRRGEGILPTDHELAETYHRQATHEPTRFLQSIQRLLIEEVQIASEHQRFRHHAAATDPTHLHVLVSWTSDKPWLVVRSGIRSSLTRRLNRDVVRRGKWFSRSASRKRVRDRAHFDYLINTYLPKHRGAQWYEHRGWR